MTWEGQFNFVHYPKTHSPESWRKYQMTQDESHCIEYLTRTPLNCQGHKKPEKTEKLLEKIKETWQLNTTWYPAWDCGRRLPKSPSSRVHQLHFSLMHCRHFILAEQSDCPPQQVCFPNPHLSWQSLTLNLKSHPPIVLSSILYTLSKTGMAKYRPSILLHP